MNDKPIENEPVTPSEDQPMEAKSEQASPEPVEPTVQEVVSQTDPVPSAEEPEVVPVAEESSQPVETPSTETEPIVTAELPVDVEPVVDEPATPPLEPAMSAPPPPVRHAPDNFEQYAKELAGRYERPHAALIPLLLTIQESDRWISPEREEEVAKWLGIPSTAVHAAATFYPLIFQKKAGKYHIQFCHNISCSLLGAEPLIDLLESELGIKAGETTADGMFSIQRAECLGCCGDAPVMLVNDKLFGFLTREKVLEIINTLRQGKELKNDTPLTETNVLKDGAISKHFHNPSARSLPIARQHGAYEAARKALFDMQPEQITAEVKSAGLRGQGGAGFPTGVKWGFVPKGEGVKYLCVNGDESEPGTCKDREILRRDPHRLIEGIIIASRAIGVSTAYVYIRREFYEPTAILEEAIREARAAGLVGKNIMGSGFDLEIYTHYGAGAYICGEETGLIESLEGKKGWPRIKPPFPAVKGLFQKPTVVNNIETLSNLPWILLNGAEKYRQRGTEKSPGTKLFCISGHVKRPGVYELPMGTNLREMIYDIAGGIREGHTLKAIIPGGSSVPVIKADQIDVAMDFESILVTKSMLGSGGIIVMDDSVSMPWALEILSRFYAHESCGQCTPCREGSAWAYKILNRLNRGGGRKSDLPTLLDLVNNIDGQTICPLGSAAAWPVQAMLRQFPEEFELLAKY